MTCDGCRAPPTKTPFSLFLVLSVPVGAKTFMWGGIPAYLRYVGGSTHTCEYSDIRTCGVFLLL